MWQNFTLFWEGKEWECEAQVFTNPSMWGIRDGRVSRFLVYDESGNVIYFYERGWDSREAPQGLVDELMKRYSETL